MPVHYDISPELNLVVYVAKREITPLAFFQTGDQVAQDPRYRADMKIILDFFYASLDASVGDLKLAVQKYSESHQSGQGVGPTAVLTANTGLHFLGEAVKTLSGDSISNFHIFTADLDAIKWLDLPPVETLNFWFHLRETVK